MVVLSHALTQSAATFALACLAIGSKLMEWDALTSTNAVKAHMNATRPVQTQLEATHAPVMLVINWQTTDRRVTVQG